MKKKLLAAMLLAMTLALAGCSDGKTGNGDAQGSGAISGEEIQSSSEAGKSSESGEGKENSAAQSSESAGKESSELDGMVSAGSKEDMGIDDSWKELYANFLEKDAENLISASDTNWRNEWSFGLIYVNDDPTPELVISSGYEAAGNIICTPVDGKVAFLQTARLSFFYKEFGNLLDNSDGNMGYYHDYVYTITDEGFVMLHEGYNSREYDNDGNLGMSFEMDGQAVSEYLYYKTIDDLIPAKDRTYWTYGSSYGDMMNYLKGNTAENYMEAYRNLIKAGVTDNGDKLDRFALIERTNYDPLLLCAGDQKFCFYAYEDGLLIQGPVSYFSETVFRLVYPGLGMIESLQYFENNEMSDANYYFRGGSLLSSYANSTAEYDENWDVKTDADGLPIVKYQINLAEVSKDEFSKYLSRNDEQFKQQLVSPKEGYDFIEYFTADQMLVKLSGN